MHLNAFIRIGFAFVYYYYLKSILNDKIIYFVTSYKYAPNYETQTECGSGNV